MLNNMVEQTIAGLSNKTGQPTTGVSGVTTPTDHHPPFGFPSDLELTRMASEMFARCDEFGPSPLAEAEPRLPSSIQGPLATLNPPSPNGLGLPLSTDSIPIDPSHIRPKPASESRRTAAPHSSTANGLPNPMADSFATATSSPFAFFEHAGAASLPHSQSVAPESNATGSTYLSRPLSPVNAAPLAGAPNVSAPSFGKPNLSLPGVSRFTETPVALGSNGTTRTASSLSQSEAIGSGVAPTANVSAPVMGGLRGFHPSLTPAHMPQPSAEAFDPHLIRKDFPILREVVHGKPLIWLDNAATTQKPLAVIDRLSQFYLRENSNIHRAAHELARRATDAYEAARASVARFINAPNTNSVVFVRGTTEAINLVAQSFGRRTIAEGDEIIVTHLEHHANIVPWQQLCAEKKARLLVAPVDDHGQILLDEYRSLFSNKTRIVSLSQVSNALGTITPAREMVEMAHRLGVPVLVDGAQSVSHMRVDVQAIDCDFFVFSGHKVFGPTGIGVLYGKEQLLNDMPPWQGGGNMIQDVTFEKTTYHAAPMRFEAGTGNIADAVGLHAAIDYVQKIGIETISRYEHDLLAYGTNELNKIPGLRIIGTAAEKAGVLSFVVAGIPTETIGKALSNEGIAVRSGHHCAQPILRRFGVESTVRASLALYNTTGDIDRLVSVVSATVQH